MVKKTKPKVKAKAKSKAKVKVAVKALKPSSSKQSKTEILRHISDTTGLSVKEVKMVFVAVTDLAKSHMTKRGSGEFSVPEMGIKIVRKVRPATKRREGRNPLTGETIMIPAKPKREVIRVRPLKSLKSILD